MGRNQKNLGAILKNSLLVECFMACKDLPQKQFLCKSTLGKVNQFGRYITANSKKYIN